MVGAAEAAGEAGAVVAAEAAGEAGAGEPAEGDAGADAAVAAEADVGDAGVSTEAAGLGLELVAVERGSGPKPGGGPRWARGRACTPREPDVEGPGAGGVVVEESDGGTC